MKALPVFFLAALFLSTDGFSASGCDDGQDRQIQHLRNSEDPDARSRAGKCLMRHYLGAPKSAELLLKVIRDVREDVLLREDLIQAFGDSPLRKKVKVEGGLGPALDQQEKQAVNHTISEAQGLFALTQAVKVMDEITPITSLEGDFFKALADIALEDSNPVLLRSAAVAALEKAAKRVVASGVYDDKSLRLTQETLNTVASRDDNGSYFSGAASAYGRLAQSRIPHFHRPLDLGPTRALASQNSANSN